MAATDHDLETSGGTRARAEAIREARIKLIAKVHRRKATVLSRQPGDAARVHFRLAVELAPDHVGIRARWAKWEAKGRDLDAAKRQYQEVLARAPETPGVAEALEAVLARQQELRLALEIAEHERRAVELSKQKLADAGEHFRQALEIDPTNVRTRFQFARWKSRMGHLGEAASEFEQLLSENHDNILALLSLADIRERQDKMEEALDLLNRAVRVDPNSKAHRFRAGFLGRMIQYDLEKGAEAVTDRSGFDRKLHSHQKAQRDARRPPDGEYGEFGEHGEDIEAPVARLTRSRAAAWPARAQQFSDFESLVRRYVLAGIERKQLVGVGKKVVTMGSCFAEHVANRLKLRGVEAFYVQMSEDANSTFANRAVMDWVMGDGANASAHLDQQYGPELRSEIAANLANCDLYIFSLGVAPCFFDEAGEFVFSKERSRRDLHFRTTSVRENGENVRHIVRLLRELNPSLEIVLTVSPVALGGTLEYPSAVIADCVSKSVLRVAVEDLLAKDAALHYWPSFEIVRWLSGHLTAESQPAFGANDGDSRHVSVWLQDLVIGLFMEWHGSSEPEAGDEQLTD